MMFSITAIEKLDIKLAYKREKEEVMLHFFEKDVQT